MHNHCNDCQWGRQGDPRGARHHPDLPVEHVRLLDVAILNDIGLDHDQRCERGDELVLEWEQESALQVVAYDGLCWSPVIILKMGNFELSYVPSGQVALSLSVKIYSFI